MENVSNHENRSLEWWRNLASRLAFLFAATILIASGIGFWYSGEMRDLRHLYDKLTVEIAAQKERITEIVQTNEILAQENAEIDQTTKIRVETVEELKAQNYELTVKYTALLKELELKHRRQ